MSERYFVGIDNSSHRYLVPLAKRDHWNKWVDLPEDNPRSWDAPDYAERFEGGLLTFESPEILL